MVKHKVPALLRMEIEPAHNGGHMITHHEPPKPASKSGAFMERPEPKKYSFGPDQHHEMLKHIQAHLGMKGTGKEANKDAEKGESPEMEPKEAAEGDEFA